ncbi:MAG: molybdenum hydroxylase [Desulfobacca sp.]|nr:molybdenum hydroxylase [Desulfobacca sp.]
MKLTNLTILIRGAGEMASGVAWRLFQSHFKIVLTEIPHPMAVRRQVSFCEAVYEGSKKVEGVEAVLISSADQVHETWQANRIPLLIDPDLNQALSLKPDVLVDAILAKKNIGTRMHQAPLVVALGPGFRGGIDAHLVIETNRGHNLGRILTEGEAEADTGVPGNIGGYTSERVLRAPAEGVFQTHKRITDLVEPGETLAEVNGIPIESRIKGILRGLIRDKTPVWAGLKVGDVDPRGILENCYTISEKALAIGGGVLEGILRRYNQN